MSTISNKNSNSPVSYLKHLTLSIDRGITDEVNQQIIKITDELSQQWQNDKVLSTFIKMTRALSDYTASGKSNINADAVALIHSIVTQMENLSSPPGIDLPTAKKQAILTEEIAKYNTLKQQIKTPSKGETQEISDTSAISYQAEMDGNVISELKSIILSLDWEITDELIQKLDKEVNRLQTYWQNSKIHLSFLQMFKSIGSYVMNKGSNTHPDAISLLNSLYRNLEKIVLSPAMTSTEQKDILLNEMKKFNDLKKIISSAKVSKPRSNLSAPMFTSPAAAPPASRYAAPSMNPMDDLIGTKSSNLSPVDDLIEEIHMLQDSGDRTHSLDANRITQSSGGATSNPEIKEVIPNRLKKQPIEEIQTRLDAFFDEDEPLSELSFADSGDEVVPYKGDTGTSGYANITSEQEPDFNNKTEEDTEGILFEDESVEDAETNDSDDAGISFEDYDTSDYKVDSSASQQSATIESNEKISNASSDATDGMVPYDLDSEFFEEDIEPVDPEPSIGSQKEQAANMQKSVEEQRVLSAELRVARDIQIESNTKSMDNSPESANDTSATNQKEMELLEELKSALGKSMFHGGITEIKEINDKIASLEQLWNGEPEKQILLKILKSLAGYFDLLAPAPEAQTLELMLYIVESMEDSELKSREASTGVTSGEKIGNIDIINVFSKYIDFQNIVAMKRPSAEEQMAVADERTLKAEREDYSKSEAYSENTLSKGETLAEKEILYDEPHQEDALDIEKKITETKSIWSKIKNWLGF
ncbi:MAG: hypothetical protein HQK73_00905 [Desulfamplus sp.]|nr:hypothetical protein [Desulfamplus sp.]